LKPFVLSALAPACTIASLALAFWSGGYLIICLSKHLDGA
jgi:hypothetical protein